PHAHLTSVLPPLLALCHVTSPRFFFSCYGAHRDLHSFPTRRSSDLSPLPRLRGRGQKISLRSFFLFPTAYPLPAAPSGATRLNLDRKSTRLNSSHVKISYAVFCLKKKKK